MEHKLGGNAMIENKEAYILIGISLLGIGGDLDSSEEPVSYSSQSVF